MPLSDFVGFPLYRDNLLTGPSNVSLAIPGLDSVISKSIGMTSSAMLLVPNLDFLLEFAKGNLGISDNLWKSVISANMNSPISANSEGVFKSFAKANDLPLDDINKYKKNGKFKMPVSAVELSSAFDGSGLKAFEKTTILSIFESQKPYMEIARTVASLFVDIEDVVARIMPLVSLNPLTHKSAIPKMNGGGGKRPKAVGFKNGEEINEALKKLKGASSKGGKIKVDKNGGVTKESTDIQSTDLGEYLDQTVNQLKTKYKIIKVQYSTGQFDPNEDYIYTFIDLPPDSGAEPDNSPPEDDEDPYDKYKPEKIILGIYNSKGVPINPNEFLRTIGYTGNQKTELDTTYKRAEWITKSEKWKFRNGDFTWPTLGTPNYVFERGLLTQVAKTAPEKYTLKKYKKDDKNILTNETAIEGDPVIDSFDLTDSDVYTRFFTEYTNIQINLAKDLEPEDKEEARKEVLSRINVPSHLENLSNYSQNKKTYYKPINGQPAFPETLKTIFKPYQIYSASASADPKLAGLNGLIWIDPEADYETKVIRVDPVFKIKTDKVKDESKLETTIKSFVKNLYEIKKSDNSSFGIEIKKNGTLLESIESTKVYNLDNWNYQNGQIINTNTFTFKMWSDEPIYEYKTATVKNWGTKTLKKETNGWTYTEGSSKITGDRLLGDNKTYIYVEEGIVKRWYYKYNQVLSSVQNTTNTTQTITITDSTFTLPTDFGSKKSVTLNVSTGSWTTSQSKVPFYSIKVTDLSNPGGTIIDPSKVDNLFLSGNELFSKGRYGVGDPNESPQEIDIIERYQMTDLDTESYYIIEGVRSTANKTGPVDGETSAGKKWYKLPQAIGAIMVFIKVLIKIFTKLVPAITKLIKLLKNPIEFITDIISEKLGESFDWLSKDAFKAFSSLVETVKKREEILKQGGSAYVDKVKQIVKNSPLKDYVFVNGFGQKISKLSSAVNDLTKSATQNATQVGNTITKNLGGAAANITTFGSGVDNNLQSQTSAIANNLQTQGQNLLNQGQNVVSNLQNQAGNIANNLQAQGQNLLNQGQGVANNLQGQAGNIINNISTTGLSFFDSTTGQVSTIVGNFSQAVSNNLSGKTQEIASLVEKAGKDTKFTKGVLSIADRAMNDSSLFGNKNIAPIIKQSQGLGDFKFLLDGVGFIPFSIFNFDLSFGMELNFSNLIYKKAPIKLLFDKSKRNSSDKKDPCASDESDTNSVSNDKAAGNNSDAKNPQDGYQIVSTWYSTGQFVEGVDYNYFYVTQQNEELLNEVDTLESTGNPDDMYLAKEKLQEAIKKNPFDETLKEKLKSLKLKLVDSATATQPILKLIISLVSLPLKIIADIIEWLLCFFKGLINPLTLPAKLAEFFSFEWLLKFVTPVGILQTLGIKFNPQLLLGWIGKAIMTNPPIDELANKFSDISSTLGDKTQKTFDKATSTANNTINNVQGQADNLKNNLVGGATEQVKKVKGYLYSDDFELANLSEFFSAPFLAPLPTFTAGNLRGLLKNISSKYISALLKNDSFEQIDQKINKLKSVVTENQNVLSTLVGKNSQVTQNFNSQVLLSITKQIESANNSFNLLSETGSTLFSGSNIANNLSGGNNLTNNVVNQITGNLQSQTGNIVNNLQGQAGNIIVNVQGQASNVVNNLQGQTSNIANQIANNLQGQTINVTNNLNNIGGSIVNNLVNVNSAILNNLTQKSAFIANQIKQTANLLLKQFFKIPFFKIIFPSLCFIEKVVNGFINFIWSLLGIEVIIPPPQIKLCKSDNPLDLLKVLKNEKVTEVNSTIPYEEQKASDSFIYEVKLSDGAVKSFLDRESLDDFIAENADINFDLQF